MERLFVGVPEQQRQVADAIHVGMGGSIHMVPTQKLQVHLIRRDQLHELVGDGMGLELLVRHVVDVAARVLEELIDAPALLCNCVLKGEGSGDEHVGFRQIFG